ncbi:MAG: TlpA family protein disulfide reductase [Bryobacteraceae bacterium]|nr:TlpA family protein disulfide reductase [Bryobacteraceae bacterium]
MFGDVWGADPSRVAITPAAERPAAPVMKLRDSSGRIVGLPDYGRVVLLDFWATWCGGCKQELPWFARFETKYKAQEFSVVAVSMDEGGWPIIKPFVESLNLPFTVLLDDGQSARRFAIKNMPMALLIDRNGRIAAKYVGLVDREDVERNIMTLLNERKRK